MATDTTRERVLSLIVSAGPITAATLAEKFGLTPAAVRRHLSALIDEGLIADHDVAGPIDRGRGRPAKSFVATPEGQRALKSAYSDVARDAMEFLQPGESSPPSSRTTAHGSRTRFREPSTKTRPWPPASARFPTPSPTRATRRRCARARRTTPSSCARAIALCKRSPRPRPSGAKRRPRPSPQCSEFTFNACPRSPKARTSAPPPSRSPQPSRKDDDEHPH